MPSAPFGRHRPHMRMAHQSSPTRPAPALPSVSGVSLRRKVISGARLFFYARANNERRAL